MPRSEYSYYVTLLPCNQFCRGERGPWPPLRTSAETRWAYHSRLTVYCIKPPNPHRHTGRLPLRYTESDPWQCCDVYTTRRDRGRGSENSASRHHITDPWHVHDCLIDWLIAWWIILCPGNGSAVLLLCCRQFVMTSADCAHTRSVDVTCLCVLPSSSFVTARRHEVCKR